MDRPANYMDFKVKHWAPFPRRFPAAFPVISSDFLVRKNHWVRHAFTTCNFSLILEGRGTYRRGEQTWAVVAPMVIIQWPGEYVEYGPPVPTETWDEVYVSYDAGLVPALQRAGLLRREEPVWPVADPAAVRAQVLELAALTAAPRPEEVVDRVDRVCERLLLETRLAPAPAAPASAIPAVVARLRRELARPADFARLAADYGMSPSTFRRRWQEVVGQPPGEYLEALRMQEASRLLVETARPVREVAHAVGFEDELYFSRRFRRARGLPPRDYRRQFALRRS
jgi:AraC-like DNA-binding protein